MGYILIQLNDCPTFLVAIKMLALTGEGLFDHSVDRSQLRPVLFGSRSKMVHEWKFHSFVG